MSPKNEMDLKCRFPLVTRSLGAIECGDGWVLLLRNALGKLDRIAQRDVMSRPRRPHLVVTRISEKHGLLDLHTRTTDGEIERIVEEAFKAAERTCEQCGSVGRRRLLASGLVRCVCDRCAAK